MDYEYKCVGAPEKAKRKRGARTRSDRVAGAMQALIEEHAGNGWEYLRTDLVPVEERSGLFGRPHEVHRAVLVFRRERDWQPSRAKGLQPKASEPAMSPELGTPPRPDQDDRLRLASDNQATELPRAEITGRT